VHCFGHLSLAVEFIDMPPSVVKFAALITNSKGVGIPKASVQGDHDFSRRENNKSFVLESACTKINNFCFFKIFMLFLDLFFCFYSNVKLKWECVNLARDG
jgi:hypothetical protein